MQEPDEEPPPRPSIWLAMHSLVAIGGSLLFVAIVLGGLTSRLHPCEKIAFGVLAIPFALFALLQYDGTFWRRESSTLLAALLQSIAVIATFCLGSVSFEHDRLNAGIGFAVAVYCAVGVFLNLRWRDRLLVAFSRGIELSRRFQFTLLEIMTLSATICAMLAIATATARSIPPLVADHVDAASVPLDLPEGANDVSYCRRFRYGFEAEFLVDEHELEVWLQEETFPFHDETPNRQFKEIVTPETVLRAEEFSGPNTATVKAGLVSRYNDGAGSGYRVVYDRDAKRAYYSFGFD
ncbi:hypothetical protein [Blastopirellula retiformator]|uniref:Uncharacterized protein n=1 Tax=Blastopirellula retiformator TaxID=2527970 RepID=A0A5C5V398_9BACT|nr:hypothetical protein [Blastopirellula retiformator]TWT33018.1 hypothetical protein Enr8_28380 [Blastopirellula retiformator]